eukprot:TRINITY_DN9737_c0_g1_i2.p2 TRINITY_DN9737_c0_g1~~TRINITY_DN9737_c0_g1_i2.p2  ORF type:complete len:243 (+),score=51.75 TRINITY_DN9737_c0_g1_i2:380-1108(+)
MNSWIDTTPYLYNVDIEEDILKKSKDILSNNSEIYKSLNFARQIYMNGYCEEDLLNYDWRQCKEDIVNDKVAMIIWNSDFINQLEDLGMDPKNIGMFPVPETKKIRMIGDYKIGISKNTKYPEASKEFLKFLFEEDRYAKAVNIMSSLKTNTNTVNIMNQLEQFNLPVVFQEDILEKQSDREIKLHNKFSSLKKNTGLDYTFVQTYITVSYTHLRAHETSLHLVCRLLLEKKKKKKPKAKSE